MAALVARMSESRNAYRVLVGRPEGKRPLGRPRRRWEDNIKINLRKVGYNATVNEWVYQSNPRTLQKLEDNIELEIRRILVEDLGRANENIFPRYSTYMGEEDRYFQHLLITDIHGAINEGLTSLRKELRIYALEGVFPDHSRGTLSLEAAVYPLQLCLGEPRRLTQGFQTIWPVAWRRLQILELRICNMRQVIRILQFKISRADLVWLRLEAWKGNKIVNEEGERLCPLCREKDSYKHILLQSVELEHVRRKYLPPRC
ncbi:hypothetical protein ANN_18515 [Periplaneta americana]|uniref:Uncharacterized protein n=1 Tax=Periplaneta americana TaxID=6978 RepID=A0ABQ8SP00_PERAM|nr:hypothetical protein ANN_18515 [Periplaneta americana]